MTAFGVGVQQWDCVCNLLLFSSLALSTPALLHLALQVPGAAAAGAWQLVLLSPGPPHQILVLQEYHLCLCSLLLPGVAGSSLIVAYNVELPKPVLLSSRVMPAEFPFSFAARLRACIATSPKHTVCVSFSAKLLLGTCCRT